MAVAAMTISACNNLIEEEGPAFGAGSDNKIVFTAFCFVECLYRWCCTSKN